MAKLLLLGLLFNAVVLVSNPGEPGPQSAYTSLVQEKKALEVQKKALELEGGLVELSLQDSAAYLVVDLSAQRITAKLGGVPLRSAPILWRYGRPGHEAVIGVFKVVEKLSTRADSARADSTRGIAVAAGDSAAPDTLKDAVMVPLRRGSPQRYFDPARRYRLSLQDGPDLWLASLPPAQSRLDTLQTRLRAWIRDFPASMNRQSIHLVLSPADAHWIFAMAVLGTRVLVIPS